MSQASSNPTRYVNHLKELCIQHKVPYEKILQRTKGSSKLSRKRRELYLIIHETFPKMSTPQIGKLFNRDHSTVVQMLKKARLEREETQALQK